MWWWLQWDPPEAALIAVALEDWCCLDVAELLVDLFVGVHLHVGLGEDRCVVVVADLRDGAEWIAELRHFVTFGGGQRQMLKW